MKCPKCGSEMGKRLDHDEPRGLPWAHANLIYYYVCKCGYEEPVKDGEK